MKRKYFNNVDYKINGADGTLDANKVIILNKDIVPKKITGTTFGAILGKNKYMNEFDAFCKLYKIDMPILNRKYVDAGIAIEPLLKKYIEWESHIEIQSFDAKKLKYDAFSKYKIFGGLPDGFVKSHNMIIEFKTSNWKNEKYFVKNGVPESYVKQTELYGTLQQSKYCAIIVIFLKDEDYANPSKLKIQQRNIRFWLWERDVLKNIADLTKAKDIHIPWIRDRTSPKYDVVQNKDLLEYLHCKNEEEWKKLQGKWILEGKMVV